MTKPLVLCILDGVGIAPPFANPPSPIHLRQGFGGQGLRRTRASGGKPAVDPHDATAVAKMPFYRELFSKYPHTELDASGVAVGLTPGTMGNSEVGHITIGAGRIINQFLRRFQIEQESGNLPRNPRLLKFIDDVKGENDGLSAEALVRRSLGEGGLAKAGGIVHVLGLMSDVGVHADINEAIAVMRIVLDSGLCICLHFISDGRDTLPNTAGKYVQKLYDAFSAEIRDGRFFFGTLIGRYYAMDRNLNWDRTQMAFDAIAMGRAEFSAPDIQFALADAYARGETDEFIKPTLIRPPTASPTRLRAWLCVPAFAGMTKHSQGGSGCGERIIPPLGGVGKTQSVEPVGGRIKPNDGILFTNFRADRARQILKMIVMPTDVLSRECEMTIETCINRPTDYAPPHGLCFSEYGGESDKYCTALLPDIKIDNTLGDVLAAAGLSQLRISETEKYTHATYYMDGERTIDYPNEEKILIQSPMAVATFDKQPEMSAAEITDKVLQKLSKFDVIIINYANGDIVGHTGIMDAAVRAMETLDAQLARLVPAVLDLGGTILITADHGKAEKMWDSEYNAPLKAHTTNPVPFILVREKGKGKREKLRDGGGLSDIAPTMLKILGLKQPKEMTGESLIKEK